METSVILSRVTYISNQHSFITDKPLHKVYVKVKAYCNYVISYNISLFFVVEGGWGGGGGAGPSLRRDYIHIMLY